MPIQNEPSSATYSHTVPFMQYKTTTTIIKPFAFLFHFFPLLVFFCCLLKNSKCQIHANPSHHAYIEAHPARCSSGFRTLTHRTQSMCKIFVCCRRCRCLHTYCSQFTIRFADFMLDTVASVTGFITTELHVFLISFISINICSFTRSWRVFFRLLVGCHFLHITVAFDYLHRQHNRENRLFALDVFKFFFIVVVLCTLNTTVRDQVV